MPFDPEIMAGLVKLLGEEPRFRVFRYDDQRQVVEALLSYTNRPDPPKVWDAKLLRSLVMKLNDKFLVMMYGS
jgi:hypothetical protein